MLHNFALSTNIVTTKKGRQKIEFHLGALRGLHSGLRRHGNSLPESTVSAASVHRETIISTRSKRQAWCLLQVKLCDPCLSALKWFVYHARRYTSAQLCEHLCNCTDIDCVWTCQVVYKSTGLSGSIEFWRWWWQWWWMRWDWHFFVCMLQNYRSLSKELTLLSSQLWYVSIRSCL